MPERIKAHVRWCSVISALLLCACASLQRPMPVNPSGTEHRERCGLPFPVAPARFIDAIEAKLPDGKKMTLIGITVIDPAERSVRAAIMTIEGLLLFDASTHNDVITLYRALPPFDGPEFRSALLRDVQFLLLPPAGEPQHCGILNNGSSICRYGLAGGMTIDVVVHPDNSWELQEYRNGSVATRTAKGAAAAGGLPGIVEFQGLQPQPYSLQLRPISAEPAQPGDAK
jgi:hypothetical protein